MGDNTTTVSAQYSNVKVLKPPDDFETIYQGRSPASFPIAVPGTPDFRAGNRGYDPNLIGGIPIPIGTRLLLWLPQFISNEGVTEIPYLFRILWRLRTVEDQEEAATRSRSSSDPSSIPVGLQGHFAGPSAGVQTDGGVSGTPGQERIIIPACVTSIAYEQTEPTPVTAIAQTNLHSEQIFVGGQSFDPTGPPIVNAGGTFGVVSQGVYPDTNADLIGPTFLPFETDAFGDEYMLLIHRDASVVTEWDFSAGGQDFQLSQLLGTAGGSREIIPGLGIYALQGSGVT